jgi:hypothetical protein
MEKRYSTTKHKSQPSQQITYTAGYYENPNPKKGHYIPCEIHPY